MPTLFSLRNVNFKDIVSYPDIEIEDGPATFICGESGSGKSTLLKLLNGVVSADSGEILYSGKRIEDYDQVELRREVLLCGQAVYLFDGSIKDNFEQYHKYRDSTIAPAAMESYLKICVADFPLDTACVTMSGGERQRVFTAICLSFRPRVILLDEPTSALDDATAYTLMTNLKAYCRENGMTLIIVSHNKAIADAFGDCVITLEWGGGRE